MKKPTLSKQAAGFIETMECLPVAKIQANEPGSGASTGSTWDRNSLVGGYVPSHLGVDSLVVGFYRGKDLIYAARVRAGLPADGGRDSPRKR
jgi:hypothetical protein